MLDGVTDDGQQDQSDEFSRHVGVLRQTVDRADEELCSDTRQASHREQHAERVYRLHLLFLPFSWGGLDRLSFGRGEIGWCTDETNMGWELGLSLEIQHVRLVWRIRNSQGRNIRRHNRRRHRGRCEFVGSFVTRLSRSDRPSAESSQRPSAGSASTATGSGGVGRAATIEGRDPIGSRKYRAVIGGRTRKRMNLRLAGNPEEIGVGVQLEGEEHAVCSEKEETETTAHREEFLQFFGVRLTGRTSSCGDDSRRRRVGVMERRRKDDRGNLKSVWFRTTTE